MCTYVCMYFETESYSVGQINLKLRLASNYWQSSSLSLSSTRIYTPCSNLFVCLMGIKISTHAGTHSKQSTYTRHGSLEEQNL